MKHLLLSLVLAVAVLLPVPAPAHADEAEVVDVRVTKTGMTWRMDVTLRHNDTGWDHFADGWEVVDAMGARLGYRKLMHPHVEEQPFTRSLSSLVVPDGTREVFVRTRCSQGGWSSKLYRVQLKP